MKNYSIYGLALSAGLSGRMKKFKPLLEYNGITFIESVLKKMNTVCDKIIVVSGFNAEALTEHLNSLDAGLKSNIELVFNENFERGMFSSLQTGAAVCNEADFILYHFVDQPAIPIEFYSEFTEQIDRSIDWLQPVYKNRNGHPVIFNSKVKEMILSMQPDGSLRDIASSSDISKINWNCRYPQIIADVDTPDDYERLLK